MNQPCLVPFVGKARRVVYDNAAHVLRLFNQGNDTLQIAESLKLPESAVVRLLDNARNAYRVARGLPL